MHEPLAPIRRKPRLAIVSTYDDLCGIAGYTRFLIKQLDPHFELEVFDLDQFFMRSTHPRVRKIADGMIKDFCLRAGDFDFVNIQLEHGTLGHGRNDIMRRFTWIAEAAPALSVTFHTVLPQEKLRKVDILSNMSKLKFAQALDIIGDYRTKKLLTSRLYALLRRLQTRKPVNVIVHTRRDMRLMRHVNGLNSVYDHPLAFIDQEQARQFREVAERQNHPARKSLPARAKIIGVFGFLSEYKGFDVAVRAMHLLPEDYHLFFFGALHPNEIRKHQAVHPYIQQLLDEAYVGKSVLDQLDDKSVSVMIDSANAHLLFGHPKDISSRLHFLGPQTDEDFARGMALCDHVVLPYLEVGQSSSGVLSLAVEMGCRVIAARNNAFVQFARYHPNTIEMFEIGNHVELAERILSPAAFPPEQRTCAYDTLTNTALYIAANTKPEAVKAKADG